MPWSIRDFIHEDGDNEIADWLADQTEEDQAKINARLTHLSRLTHLHGPLITWFKGKWNGVCEVRIKGTLVFRILGCRGPGEKVLTLLVPTHKKRGDVKASEKDRALVRTKVVRDDPKRTTKHDFEE